MIKFDKPDQITIYKYAEQSPDMVITKCRDNLLFDIQVDADNFVQFNCSFKKFTELLKELRS